ncbi:hypothetical protein SO802_016249 [Lithocarpus litseifolius]|uniref:RING-type E3 ubiquitin transferase n=1 Tax=Lithocarpus litseifolius TaxID=425828 RepID=A0AAW2CYG6_9ROSI
MASGHENSEDPVTSIIEEMTYVAVGTDVKDCQSILLWALRNFGGKRICIVHVHRPAQRIPNGLGGLQPASSLDERIVRDYRKTEWKILNETLEEYLSICRREGVQAQRVWIEMDDIGKGIVELISRNGIKELVMGGALDKHYKEKMSLRSKKAKYVCKRAPLSCLVQFICSGRLIYTREEKASSDTETGQAKHLIPRSITWEHDRDNTKSGASNHWRSNSVNLGHNGDITKAVPSNCLRSNSVTLGNERENGGKRLMHFLVNESIEERSSPKNKLEVVVEGIGNFDEWDGSIISPGSTCSSFPPKKVDDLTIASWNANGLDLRPISPASTNSTNLSASSLLQPSPTLTSSASTTSRYSSIGSRSARDVSFYDKLLQVIEEAGTEAQMRRQAQRELLETIRMAEEERKKKNELEEKLAKQKEELEKVKNQSDQVMEFLWISQEENALLKRRIEELQKDRDELMMERDSALKEANGLRRKQAEATRHIPQFFSEFLLTEIEEATQNFDESLKIGQGGYGSIYKGLLRQTEVAIKRLQSQGSQGPSEFQMEVRVLSQLRHLNLVKLIGSCPEDFALIYEYLPNGSLEDRLRCRDNSPPLSWQTRIRIATELCSVLVYLHSNKPHSIVHGDLKPSNILLDLNFVSKLSDFGICRMLFQDRSSSNNTTVCHITVPKGTFAYIDPEFLQTGELTTKSDVYSFGVILLQLLTSRPAFLIANEVKRALEAGYFKALLDPLAGNWPIELAQELAWLALWCCGRNRKGRPDLSSDVWKVLQPMRDSCGASILIPTGS